MMPSDCNGVSCFQQIYEINLEFTSMFGYFHFSVSSSTSLTSFQLPKFVSAEPSQTILSIDRSEPRFERHTGGKITKTLKNDGNFDGFLLIFD